MTQHFKAIKNKQTGGWATILNGKIVDNIPIPFLFPMAVQMEAFEPNLENDDAVKYFRSEYKLVTVKVVDLSELN